MCCFYTLFLGKASWLCSLLEVSGDVQCEDIQLDMIRKCLFLVCQCFRQTWKKSTIILTGNNRVFGGFNAYKTNKQQVFRLVLQSNSIDWLIPRRQNRQNLLLKQFPTRKKIKSRHKVIPKKITEAETKNRSLFTINKKHISQSQIQEYFFQRNTFHIFPTSIPSPPPKKKKQNPTPVSPRKNLFIIPDTPATVWITSSPSKTKKS